MKIPHVVFEQTGWKFHWLDGKIPLCHMQTVFCFRSVLLYNLFFWGGGVVVSVTLNMEKISETARGIRAEVCLWSCVN